MKIDHAALYARDLEAMKAFFVQYFDASCGEMYHNMKTGFRSYFLSFADGCRLEIMSKPDVDASVLPRQHAGYIHLAFSVGSKEAVDDLTARLQRDGYEVTNGPRTTGDGYYESCIAGPEDVLVELTV